MATPTQSGRCQVEIVAVLPTQIFRKSLPVPRHQTIAWVVNASGLLALHPELREAPLGVWGQKLPLATQVQDGDRIEVYAPVLPEALKKHRANLLAKKESAKVHHDE